MRAVVVIDDDTEDLEIISHAIESLEQGLECLCFSDTKGAVEYLTDSGVPLPVCIFIDTYFPTAIGYDCLTTIRKLSRIDSVPIGIFCSLGRENEVQKFLDLGANFVFDKPSSIEDYRNTIEKLITSMAL